MKHKDVAVGGKYLARVSSKIVTVRLDAIDEVVVSGPAYFGRETRLAYRFQCTNLSTGRKLSFRSAAKFRGPAPVNGPQVQAVRQDVLAQMGAYKNTLSITVPREKGPDLSRMLQNKDGRVISESLSNCGTVVFVFVTNGDPDNLYLWIKDQSIGRIIPVIAILLKESLATS